MCPFFVPNVDAARINKALASGLSSPIPILLFTIKLPLPEINAVVLFSIAAVLPVLPLPKE